MYTMTEEGATPLENILKSIEKEFKGDVGLEADADADELKAFLKHVLPDFDEDKVYPSDIKKLIAWYKIIREHAPEVLEDQVENTEEAKETEPEA
jgi:hypothetical protein